MDILKVLSIMVFGDYELYGIVTCILTMVGLYGVFRKCGEKKPWLAFVPFYNEYTLARCVGNEVDGRTIYWVNIIMRLMQAATVLVKTEGLKSAIAVLVLPVFMVGVIYRLRIFSSLCRMFKIRKINMFLLLFLDFLIYPILGYVKKYQPQWQVEDVEVDISNYFQPSQSEVMSEGLNVNLKKREAKEFFSKKTLLKDVHMYIKPGRMVLLLGGSGAGKTTLLNAVNGYEKADAQIHLNGGDVYKDYKRMQYDIGFVPQLDLMRGNDTVLHTLMDAATLRLPSEFRQAERKERVEAVMDIFGLKPVAGNMVTKLSGGQRKRLSIAMEFLSNPALFILDEPDSGLDGVMARELMEQLRAIANQGKIVIVITHTPDRVIDLFDDVIVLAKDKNRTGRLAYYGPIDEAKTFFGKETMEKIVLSINRQEEGGEGRADEFIEKYAEVMQNV